MDWFSGVTEIVNNIIKWIMRDTDPETIKKRIILKFKKDLETKKKELVKVEENIKKSATLEKPEEVSVYMVYQKKLKQQIKSIEKTLKEFEK